MFIKKIGFLLLLCIVLSSCSSAQNNTKKCIKINLGTEPPSLDPRKISDNISAFVINMLFEGLLRKNIDGSLEPALASSYSISEDELTYTFTLKETFWSNGVKLTSYDFESTWKTILSPEFPSPQATSLYILKNARDIKEGLLPTEHLGVKALDDLTLKVELEYPSSYFLELTSHPSLFPYPEHIAKVNAEGSIPTAVIGPFAIDSWKLQNKMTYKKNEKYWDYNSVSLDEILFSFVSNPSTELSMYEDGDLHWVGAPFSSLPEDALPLLKTRDDFHDRPIIGLYYYIFNTEAFPFNNPNIRKALTLAINRQEIIDHVLQNAFTPATRLLPQMSMPRVKDLFLDADESLAKAYFIKGCEELQISPDKFPEVILSYNTTPHMHYKVAQAIQQQWRKTLGIKAVLETQEWKVYLDNLNRKQFQIARCGYAATNKDPLFLLEPYAYEKNVTNIGGWHSKEFANLYQKALYMRQSDKKIELIEQAEELMISEMPIAPLFFYSSTYMKKQSLKDVVVDSYQNIDLKWADIR